MSEVCRYCGCRPSQVVGGARTLGLEEELERGIYTCCQIVAWADEQWLAWAQAAEEDKKVVADLVKPLEYADQQMVLVPIRKQRRSEPSEKKSSFFGPGGDRRHV
jgi:hypothetical protein